MFSFYYMVISIFFFFLDLFSQSKTCSVFCCYKQEPFDIIQLPFLSHLSFLSPFICHTHGLISTRLMPSLQNCLCPVTFTNNPTSIKSFYVPRTFPSSHHSLPFNIFLVMILETKTKPNDLFCNFSQLFRRTMAISLARKLRFILLI